jgi:CDP-diacylglycerol--glycerol-3-phosphate 3-phosphatidyltransferase
VTKLGKVMDPVADKLLISCSFIMLADVGWIPAWAVCIIVAREIAVTGLRNIVAQEGEDVSSSWLGKYKTGFQIAAAIPHLIHYSYFGIDMVAIGNFFLVGAVVFTLWSGVDYFMKYRNLMDL